MAQRRPNDQERIPVTTDGSNVVELSFSVAEMVRNQVKLEARFDRSDEKNEIQHNATRAMIAEQAERTQIEMRRDYATKTELEGVRRTAEGAASNISKIGLTVIGALISGAIALLYTFAQRGS